MSSTYRSTPYENASVSSIDVEDYEGDIRTTDSFRNSFSTHQLFKIARTRVTMLEKQDKTIDEIRQVGEKVDRVSEKVDRAGGESGPVKDRDCGGDKGTVEEIRARGKMPRAISRSVLAC